MSIYPSTSSRLENNLSNNNTNPNTTSFRDLFSSFCSSSTIHGTFFIKESKTSFGKLIWSCIILIGIGMSSWIIQKSFQSWKSNPIVTSVMQISIEELDFPSITICHMESNRFGYIEQELNNIGEFTTNEIKKMLLSDIIKLLQKSQSKLDHNKIKLNNEDLEREFCNKSHFDIPLNIDANKSKDNLYGLFNSYLNLYSNFYDMESFNNHLVNHFSATVLENKDTFSIFDNNSSSKAFLDLNSLCDGNSIRSFLFFHLMAQKFYNSTIQEFRFGTVLKWLYDHALTQEDREEFYMKYTPKEDRFYAKRFIDNDINCTISIPSFIAVLSGDESARNTQNCLPDNSGYSEELSKIMLNSQNPKFSEIPFLMIPFCWYGEYEHRELTKNNTAYCRTLKESINAFAFMLYFHTLQNYQQLL
ncbi:uncharacterized protein [Lepeophtheirus salmonis]